MKGIVPESYYAGVSKRLSIWQRIRLFFKGERVAKLKLADMSPEDFKGLAEFDPEYLEQWKEGNEKHYKTRSILDLI